jgi:hypothetical protein
MSALLDEARYRAYLAETHPHLGVDEDGLGMPSFMAPLDFREPLLPGLWRALAVALGGAVPALGKPRALFLGTPFERYDQTHILDEVVDPTELWHSARQEGRRRRARVVVMTNVSPAHPRFSEFCGPGVVAVPSFPDMTLRVGAGTLDDHLVSLHQKDRSSVRRNIRNFNRGGLALERLSSSAGVADHLYAAYRPLYDRARVKWQAHTAAYFRGLAELDDRVHLTVARAPGGTVAGVVVNFQDGDGFQAGRIGIHPDWYRRDGVYFRLLYHVIEEAMAHGGGTISLEPTSYRLKRHLGAQARPMCNLMVGVGPIWGALLRLLSPIGRHSLRHLRDPARLEAWY